MAEELGKDRLWELEQIHAYELLAQGYLLPV
jgi:hypothetical protein